MLGCLSLMMFFLFALLYGVTPALTLRTLFSPLFPSAMCWLCQSSSRRTPACLPKARPKTLHSSMCCALPPRLLSSCTTRRSHTWTKVRRTIHAPKAKFRFMGDKWRFTFIRCQKRGFLAKEGSGNILILMRGSNMCELMSLNAWLRDNTSITEPHCCGIRGFNLIHTQKWIL